MLKKMLTFIKQTKDEDTQGSLSASELQLAVAALLIRASIIDGDIHELEQAKLVTLLQKRFDISAKDVADLVVEGLDKEKKAVDLYGFTRVITQRLDVEGRRHIVEMLWEVVLADGVLDDYESNLVWRVSELIGVSTRERVVLRQIVAARLEKDSGSN